MFEMIECNIVINLSEINVNLDEFIDRENVKATMYK